MAASLRGAFEAELMLLPGCEAGVDLSAKQYHMVKFNGDGAVVPCSGAGERAIGILQDAPARVTRACSVAIGGVSKCAAGGAIAQGAYFTTNAAGKAITAGAGQVVMGYAATEAKADGDLFAAVITFSGSVPA